MAFQTLDLGLMNYGEAFEVQKEILQKVLDGTGTDTLLLVEHPPILTLGASFHNENLLHDEDWYRERGITIEKSDRGGDVTYHAPGQLVAYPIFSLEQAGKDLHRWMRLLEETVMVCLREFGLEGRRFPPHTGVWIDDRKICAMGVKVRRWVSFHGLALNCDNSLEPFDWIVPCGIQEYGVTSVSREVGRVVTVDEVKPKLESAFRQLFP